MSFGWKGFVVVVVICVSVWLSLPGLSRDTAGQEEGMEEVSSRMVEHKRRDPFKLALKEQARRVQHIRDICNDWKDQKQVVKQVVKYIIK